VPAIAPSPMSVWRLSMKVSARKEVEPRRTRIPRIIRIGNRGQTGAPVGRSTRDRSVAMTGGSLAAELLGFLVRVRGVVELAEHAHVRPARVLLLFEGALLDLDFPVGT